MSTVEADLRELVADHRRRRARAPSALSAVSSVKRAGRLAASSSRPSPLRSVRPIDASSALRLRRIVRRLRQLGRVPRLVARRDRAEDRRGRAEVHRVGEDLPIDGQRDRLPQLVALDPRGARIAGERARLQVEPQRVGVDRHAEIEELQPPRVGRALQRRVVLRAAFRVAEMSICPASSRSSCAFWSGTISTTTRSR